MSGGHHDKPHLPHGSFIPFWLGGAMALVGLGLITFGRNLRLSNSSDAVQAASANVPLAAAFFGGAVLFLLLVIFAWIAQDIKWWNTNTGTGLGMAKAGTLLFISSEVFIFGALFSSYFTFQRLSSSWPDGEFPFHDLTKVIIFTLFLFASSATVHQAEKKLRAGDKKGFDNWLLGTIILGAIFMGGQVWEYYELVVHEHFTLGSSQYATSFYMMTGTHGLHVAGGLIALIFAYVRSKKGNFDEHRHAYVESVALYWHFVDLVWVFVLTTLYFVPKFLLGA